LDLEQTGHSGYRHGAIGRSGYALAYQTGLLRDFVTAGLWLWLYWAIIILLTIGSLIFIGYGLNLILRREEIFHERSQGMPPAVPDFPLKCTYDIYIEENVSAQLGNVFHATHNMVEQNGRITTTIIPIQNELETFEEYKKRYESHAGRPKNKRRGHSPDRGGRYSIPGTQRRF
jgi:hypothetical protein